jgi:hypothetical protein
MDGVPEICPGRSGGLSGQMSSAITSLLTGIGVGDEQVDEDRLGLPVRQARRHAVHFDMEGIEQGDGDHRREPMYCLFASPQTA